MEVLGTVQALNAASKKGAPTFESWSQHDFSLRIANRLQISDQFERGDLNLQ